jgi:ketosteroid isomerase-like protein
MPVSGTSLGRAIAAQDLELVEDMVDAWNRGDRSAWTEAFDDDVVWFALPGNPDFPEPVHGRPAMLEVVRQWVEPWDRYRLETLELTEHGDTVLWTARHIGSQDRTGMTLDVSMSAAIKLRDGRIAEIRFFTERAEAVEAAESPE